MCQYWDAVESLRAGTRCNGEALTHVIRCNRSRSLPLWVLAHYMTCAAGHEARLPSVLSELPFDEIGGVLHCECQDDKIEFLCAGWSYGCIIAAKPCSVDIGASSQASVRRRV